MCGVISHRRSNRFIMVHRG